MSKENHLLQFPVKLVIELLKHAATVGLGENATKVIVDSTMQLFEQETLEEFNRWLDKPQTIKQINKAIENAEACFRDKTKIAALRDGISKLHGLSLVGHPALLDSLQQWRTMPGAASWNDVLYQIFKEDFGGRMTEQALRIASREYELCLRKQLAMLADTVWTPKIVAEAVLRNEELLEQIESRLIRISTLLTTRGIRASLCDAFRDHYLGTEDGKQAPRPFGGREKEIERLNHWLLEESQRYPYAVLTGRAGKGKSALLLHWLKQPDKDLVFDGWEVAYYPISSRYGTNREVELFATLAERIGEIYQVDVNIAQKGIDDRGTVYALLRNSRAPQRKKILVVLDGLDEADSLETVRILFPFSPPENVRFLVAARNVVEADNSAGIKGSETSFKTWVYRLNWQESWGIYHIDLPGLSTDGIANILNQMGNPLADIGSQQEIINELYRLSEHGEPLIIELYIQILQSKLAQQKQVSPDDLKRLNPGLDAYFDLWIEDQKLLWGGKNRFIELHVRALRDYCAFSKGRLSAHDLLWLDTDAFDGNPEMIEDAQEVLSRFITKVPGQHTVRYFFAHPKLNEFFQNKQNQLAATSTFHMRFVAYGEKILDALETGELLPDDVADKHDYILQYFSDHLDEIQAKPSRYYRILSEGWLRSWEALDGIEKGFMREVDKVWGQAKNDKEQGLPIQFLAGLCHASVKTLSTNISQELLLTLYKRNHLKDFQVVNFIEQIPNHKSRLDTYFYCLPVTEYMVENDRGEYLSIIQRLSKQLNSESEHVKELMVLSKYYSRDMREQLLDEALSIARQITNAYDRADALAELAMVYNGKRREDLLQEILSVISQVENDYEQARVLAKVVDQLPEKLLEKALSIAQQINSHYNRSTLLLAFVRIYDGIMREQLLKEALDAAWEVDIDQIEELAPVLAKHLPERLLEVALVTARRHNNEIIRASMLNAMARFLPKNMLADAVDIARQIDDKHDRSRVFLALAMAHDEVMRKELLEEALGAARQIDYEYTRAMALQRLAITYEGQQREVLLSESLSAVRQIDYGTTRVMALQMLAAACDGDMRESLLQEAFGIAQIIIDENERAQLLAILIESLSKNLQEEALDVARQITDGVQRAKVLRVLAEVLPESSLGKVLDSARQINSEAYRAQILLMLAKIHSDELQSRLLRESMDVVRQMLSAYDRAALFQALALSCKGKTRENLLLDALNSARQISNETHRTWRLWQLAKAHDGEARANLLDEALDTTKGIKSESQRANELQRLAKFLPPELLEKACAIARGIGREGSRAIALLALAKVSTDVEQANLIEDVLDIALHSRNDRLSIILKLEEDLPKQLLGKALNVVQLIDPTDGRVSALLALAKACKGDERPQLLEKALSLAHQIDNEEQRTWALLSLATSSLYERDIQEKLLSKLLHATNSFEFAYSRVNLLQNLADHLSDDLLDNALDFAQYIEPADNQAGVLLALAKAYKGEKRTRLLEQVLETVKYRDSEPYRGSVLKSLSELAEQLPENIIREALGAALLVRKETDRAEILGMLAMYLPPDMLGKLFEIIKAFSDLDQTTSLLLSLCKRYHEFSDVVKMSEIELFTEILSLYKRSTRYTYFVVVGYILQIMLQREESLVIESVNAMRIVTEWWP